MADQQLLAPDQFGGARQFHSLTPGAPLSLGPLTMVACSAVFLLSFVFAVIGTAVGSELLSLSGAMGVVFFGVGAAPWQLVGRMNVYARLTAAALTGFGVILAGGALMAYVPGLWHPQVAGLVVGLTAAGLHLRGLFAVRHEIRPQFMRAQREWSERTRRASVPVGLSLALTGFGTLLWLIPAVSTSDPQPGVWGLLPAMSPLWYTGILLVVLGFAVGRVIEVPALLATLSFGLASTLTPALVYDTPRTGSAAKQMLITQYVLTHHHIAASAGIYQAFSGLFAGMAWICALIHVHGILGHDSLIGLATFWPVIVLIPRVMTLRLFTERLLETPGRRWIAVMLVMLVDTINDANYFSPQSVGYILAVGAVAFAISGFEPRPVKRQATFMLLALVGVALAPTHELSPYLAIGALLVLAVFGEAPWWSFVFIAVPAVGWDALVHNAIQANFSFGQLFEFSNLLPPSTPGVPGLVRYAAIGYQSHALLIALLILIGFAAVGFLADIRTRWAWGYALCPAVGIGLVLINPYGNEGIFRSSLFAIPWLAVMANLIPEPHRLVRVMARRGMLTAAISVALIALLATFFVAEWGDDGVWVLFRSDLAVAEELRAKPSQNAFVLPLGGPSSETFVAYPPFLINYTVLDWDTVTTSSLRDLKPGPAALVELTDSYGVAAAGYGATPRSPLYIFWSPSMRLMDAAYATQSLANMDAWLNLLKHSPNWRIAYRSGDSYLFELRRGRETQTGG